MLLKSNKNYHEKYVNWIEILCVKKNNSAFYVKDGVDNCNILASPIMGKRGSRVPCR